MNSKTNKYNLHTHSFYCGHGEDEIASYVKTAEEIKLDIIGFTEHLPFSDNRLQSSRMHYDQIKHYEKDCRIFKDYKGIKVLLGYECDYFQEDYSYFLEVRNRVDYLISGTHFLKKAGKTISPFSTNLDYSDMVEYSKKVTEAISSGLFSFIAHPDLFLARSVFNDKTEKIAINIISCALKYNVPLEINARGTQNLYKGEFLYPKKEFWLLAKKMGVKIVSSADAHKASELYSQEEKIRGFIKSLDINLAPCSFSDNKLSFY